LFPDFSSICSHKSALDFAIEKLGTTSEQNDRKRSKPRSKINNLRAKWTWEQLGNRTRRTRGKTRDQGRPEGKASQQLSVSRLCLQNLHPRFKSGRRLQFHSANPELLEARTRGKGATSLVSRRAWPDLPHPVSRTSARSGGHRGNRASRQRLPRHSIDRFFQAIEHDKNLEQRVRAKAEMYFDEVFPHGEPMSDGSWVETIPPDFGFEDLS